mgnify:CR=1 FL=1
MCSIPDSGQLKDLNRIDSSRAQNNFFLGINILDGTIINHFDPYGPCALEQYFIYKLCCLHCQILVFALSQVSITGVPSDAIFDIHVIHAKAFLLEAIDIVGVSVASLHSSFNESIIQGLILLSPTSVMRTIPSSILIGSQLMCLRLPEIRQNVLVSPSR